VIYLFDNNISLRLVGMLRALGVDTLALREEYPSSIDDVALLQQLRGRNCAFVTADMKIQRRPAEVVALRECGVTALFFGPFWPKLAFWPQAAWLAAKWPTIDGFASGVELGTWAEVKQNGKAHVIHR